jgi:hypothetical protein
VRRTEDGERIREPFAASERTGALCGDQSRTLAAAGMVGLNVMGGAEFLFLLLRLLALS